MRIFFLTLVTTLVTSASALGLTYTTINDGDWSDVNTVWSTNGVSPCHCSPGTTVNADTIIVQNNLSFGAHLILENKAFLWVKSGSCLVNPLFNLNVRNGRVLNNGILSVNELNVGKLSLVECFSSVLNLRSRMLVSGAFSSNFSNIYVANGNIEVNNTGTFTITNNTKVFFTAGNFNNYGTTTVNSGSCIQLTAGNFKNFNGGVFSGNGSLISDVGNITNEGTWDINLAWCVAGNSTNMPSAENCSTANANCTFAPLAAELLSFNIIPQDGSNIINWYTMSEENGEAYSLERSKDGNNWELLATIPARNPGAEVTHYVFIDDQPISGLSYYKLTLRTTDGTIGFSAILGVNTENIEDVVIFPNPTSDHITVRFSKPVQNVKISIVDAGGATREMYTSDSMIEETFHLPYPCGLYFVRIESETFNDVLKVIKK